VNLEAQDHMTTKWPKVHIKWKTEETQAQVYLSTSAEYGVNTYSLSGLLVDLLLLIGTLICTDEDARTPGVLWPWTPHPRECPTLLVSLCLTS
jgi:hypothetical protein